MKKPNTTLTLQILTGALALTTLVLWIVYLVDRGNLRQEVMEDLAGRRNALASRIETLIRFEAERLHSLEPEAEKKPPDVELVATAASAPFYGRQVGGENLYTAVIEEGEPAILVGVAQQEAVYFFSKLPLTPVRDAMAEVAPPDGGRVYLTSVSGRPVLRHPEPGGGADDPEKHRKFRRSSAALDGIADGECAKSGYMDLDDRAALGAYCLSEIFHGGLVVEQEERVALAEVRGVQLWHIAGGLTAIVLVVLILVMLVPRARFTKDLFRLFAYAKKYWPIIAVTLLMMGLYAGGNMVRLTLMKVIFDDVLLGKGAGAAEALRWVMMVFVVIVLVMSASSWVKIYLIQWVSQSTVNDIRVDVASHLLRQDMKFFDRQRAGELLSRLSNDVAQTKKSLSLIFGEFFQEPLMLIGALSAAFVTNWRLTIMLFLGLPLVAFPIAKLGRMVKKYAKRRQAQQGVVTQVMMQTVTGIRTVKGFQMEDRERDRLKREMHRLLRQSVRVGRTVAFSRTLVELINSLAAVVILAVGGYMVIYGIAGATAADLMTLSVIMAQMYKPIKDLTRTYNKIQESMAGAERIFEIIDRQPEIVDRPGAVALEKPARSIAFENVTFAYEEQPVLRNVSFTANVGEVVALVGETGAGKSTVTDLIARFYDVTGGRVTIDDVDVRDYTVRSIRRATSTVAQDAFLFNTTVKENILYARPTASFEEVVQAAKAARIHDEIMEMDQGYETAVGERGSRISGGQRQRMTIARALLKDSPILILDEATSALDSQTEALVQDALDRLMAGRTTFVIAHRLSTINHADRILVFKEGELVEQGTHEELMAVTDGVYSALHQIQFAGSNGKNGHQD
jgi:ATP-binding cassette, subfamily B, bacterial MsbA